MQIWQPIHLENERVLLRPLTSHHHNLLYKVASDPLIWEQHPNPDRYKPEVFANYFEGALSSGGAFIVYDKEKDEAIGCTRFYDHEPENNCVKIGYTFFSRSCWGKGFNPMVKRLMIDYAFLHVNEIIFHVGANNIRSQKAMERLGAIKIGEELVAYYGEPTRNNFVYRISAASK